MACNHIDYSPNAFALQSNDHQRMWSCAEPSTSGIHTSINKTRFPVAFPPSDYSVICGRGKASFDHVGNLRFRALASMYIERYSRADRKAAKSAIVSEIISMVRQAGGNFCKYKRGTWFEVGDQYARDKVGALLRDLLHTQYRSSAKAKVGRRTTTRMDAKQKKNQIQLSGDKRVDGGDDSDDSSTTSSCWGRTTESLGFKYWLEDSDDFFDIDVFED
jgi:hypothetical protein